MTYWISLASMLLGIRGFLCHGGPVVNAAAVYNIAHALMVGYAGVYISTVGYLPVPNDWLNAAASFLYVHLIVLNYAFWNSKGTRKGGDVKSSRGSQLALTVGVGGLLFGLTGTFLIDRGSSFSVSTGYLLAEGLFASGAVLCVAALNNSMPGPMPSLTLAGATSLTYLLLVHDGGGRLRVIVLALALLVLISGRYRLKALKPMSLAALPVAMYIMGLQRIEFTARQNPVSAEGATGLESLVSPLWAFAKLMFAYGEGEVEARQGVSFLSPLQFLGVYVSDEPPFAFAVAQYTRPWIENPEYSDAAHLAGEFLYNFGYLGLLAYVPVVGLAVRKFDQFVSREPSWSGVEAIIWTAVAAMAMASLLELIWSGWHAGLLRFASRSVLLIGLLAVSLLLAQRQKRHHVRDARVGTRVRNH